MNELLSGIICLIVVTVVGFAVFGVQNLAINEYCLNKTGYANWTVEECNVTVLGTIM